MRTSWSHGDPDPERLAADFREIMAIEHDDGLLFDVEALAATAAEMINDEVKQRQWRAYAASIELENVSLESVVEKIWELVSPSCARISATAGAT